MMIPLPSAGMLKAVHGVEEAKQIPLITGVEITAKLNHLLVPLPEGASYLGFIFAGGNTPQEVEEAIRKAHGLLICGDKGTAFRPQYISLGGVASIAGLSSAWVWVSRPCQTIHQCPVLADQFSDVRRTRDQHGGRR
jgi:hypothetical protein